MNIQFNSSETSVVGGYKLYTGVINYKVVAINPNKAQLEELGFKPKEEPVYVSDDQDKVTFATFKKTRLDFILRNEALNQNVKHSIWLENRIKTYSTGSTDIVNDFGQDTKGSVESVKSNPNMSWFKHEGIRQGYAGEANLIKFIAAWGNVTPGTEIKLEKFSTLVNSGDFSEMNQLFSLIKNNEVALLTGIKDDKYLTTYSGFYKRASVTTNKGFDTSLKNQEFKHDYQNSFEVKEYTQPTPSASPAVEVPQTVSGTVVSW